MRSGWGKKLPSRTNWEECIAVAELVLKEEKQGEIATAEELFVQKAALFTSCAWAACAAFFEKQNDDKKIEVEIIGMLYLLAAQMVLTQPSTLNEKIYYLKMDLKKAAACFRKSDLKRADNILTKKKMLLGLFQNEISEDKPNSRALVPQFKAAVRR